MTVTVQNAEVNFWNFPAGERGVRVNELNSDLFTNTTTVTVHVNYTSDQDFVDMLLVVNALRNMGVSDLQLVIPYFPYARQDRVMVSGESLSLQVAVSFVKMCNFDRVFVQDPHSDVLQGMFEPGKLRVITQDKLLSTPIQIKAKQNYALLSPDAGALKKVYKLAQTLNCDVIEAGKVRDVKTGNIVRTKVDDFDKSAYDTLVIVDDIIDGGRTFIELARVVRGLGYKGKLMLFATHGIFSQGKKVLEDVFDCVFVINDMSKEK